LQEARNVFDAKLTQLKHYFGIFKDSDWQDVSPAMILRQDGIGPKTLEYIRAVLALRGLALKDDRTPEYWQQHLDCARVLSTMGDDDEGNDRGIVVPFTVIVDSAEQDSFTFQGLRADADQQARPLIVPTERRALGRHPDSLGDYSLDSGIGRCHVERKSMEDAHGTILGWDGRRDRFEVELENLARMEAGLVVVECSFADLLRHAPARKNPAAVNAKIIQRSILAWMRRYHVPWCFSDSRRMAEINTFRFLEGWHRDESDRLKAAEVIASRARRKEREQLEKAQEASQQASQQKNQQELAAL
jgi:hypothetical protein